MWVYQLSLAEGKSQRKVLAKSYQPKILPQAREVRASVLWIEMRVYKSIHRIPLPALVKSWCFIH